VNSLQTYRRRSSFTSCLAALLAGIYLTGLGVSSFSSVSSVMAAPITTWSGGAGNADWSSATNWSTLPTTSGTWGLVFGGTTQTSATNNIGTITIDLLSFTNNGTVGKTASFTLSGSTLALSSATIVTTATSAGSVLVDTVANALTLTGSNSITLGSGHNLSLSGPVSGGGALSYVSSSAGAYAYVSGSNSYSGGTTVSAGAVQNSLRTDSVGSSNNAFGTGDIAVSGSGTVVIRNNSSISNNFSIAGVGTTANNQALGAVRGSFGSANQTSTLTGTVSLSANATIQAAATISGSGGRLVIDGPVDLSGNQLTVAPALAGRVSPLEIAINGIVSGSGSLVATGSGSSIVSLTGSNDYSGGTQLVSGILRVGNASALGTGLLNLAGGTLDLNGQNLLIGNLSGSSSGLITSLIAGPASINSNVSGESTYNGTIADGSGSVSFGKAGSGVLNITSSNSYSGGTLVTAGILQNGSGAGGQDYNSNAFGTGDIVVSGSGTVRLRNDSTISNNISLAGSGTTSNFGALRASFGLANQTTTVSGSVSLSSNATISAAGTAGGSGGELVVAGPINLGASDLTLVANLAGGSAASPLKIVLAGSVTGSGAVVVDGPGYVLLNGNNLYTGSTTVRNGTVGGDGTGVSDVVVQSGATINPGSDLNTTGSLGVGSLQLDAGATAAMAISGTSSGTFDQIVSANAVTYGGALVIDFLAGGFQTGDLWQLFSGSSFSGNFSSVTAIGSYGSLTFSYLNNGEWKADLGGNQTASFYVNNDNIYEGRFAAGQLVVVPEPSAIAICGIGLVVIGLARLRKRIPSMTAVATSSN